MVQVNSQIKILCHSIPAKGHAIPVLRIVEIVTKQNKNIDIKFVSSKFFTDSMQELFPSVQMISIDDGLTFESYRQNIRTYKLKFVSQFMMKMHKAYFQSKQDLPDLLICDIFSQMAMAYARRNKVKCIVNSLFPYAFTQNILNLPHLGRSFSIGGFTVEYPPLYNYQYMTMGFKLLQQASSHHCKVLVNSVIGLQNPNTVPSHHIFTGLLPNTNNNTPSLVEEELRIWTAEWKAKGKDKFLFIAFGTEITISQAFAMNIQKAVEATEYPAIWACKEGYANISSKYIFSRKWLNQQAILGLPQIRGFVSHCGWGSVTQAVISAIPLLCIPVFADQIGNARLAHQKQIGIQLDKPDSTTKKVNFDAEIPLSKLAKAITEIMEEDKYAANMRKISRICRAVNTEQKVYQTIMDSIEHGHEHLIDHYYDHSASRNTFHTIRMFVCIAVFLVALWLLS